MASKHEWVDAKEQEVVEESATVEQEKEVVAPEVVAKKRTKTTVVRGTRWE